MERDHKRSNTRDRFPPIKPGRTVLTSSGDVKREPSYTKQYILKPCPPGTEPTKRPRPTSGRSSSSIEDIKRQKAGSDHSLNSTIMEEIHRLSPAGDRLVMPTEVRYQRSRGVQYLSPAVIEEINRHRTGGDQYLASAVADEIRRQVPDSERCDTPVVELIKRQKSNNAHSLNSIPEDSRLERPDSAQRPYSAQRTYSTQRSDSAQKMITSPEVPDAHTLPEELPPSAYIDNSVMSEFEDKAASSSSKMDFLRDQTISVEEKLKSISAQLFRNVHSTTPELCANSSDVTANRAPTPVVVDPKAERKRRKREKKEREREREAKKLEEARQKEQEKLEAERLLAEISRNRSMFNGNRDVLPSIGSKTAEVNFYIGKLPDLQDHKALAATLPENNAVDVIRKHDAQVRTTAFLREISQDYINASADLMEPFRKNEAVEIIDHHEEEHGRSYTNSYFTRRNRGSSERPSSSKSRCPSGVSRRGPQ